MRLLRIAALLLACFVFATAQDSLSERAKTFRNSEKFEVSYDRFKHQTRITVDGLILKAKPRLEMRFHAHFTGVRPYYARSMVLTFYTTENPSRFRYHRELEIITDGKRSRFEKGTWLGRRMPIPNETLTFAITLEEAREMARADLTEIRVSMVEVVLTSEHKEALRDFLDLLNPARRSE